MSLGDILFISSALCGAAGCVSGICNRNQLNTIVGGLLVLFSILGLAV